MAKHTQLAWEAHTGLDYTVVMLPGETTDNASIRVYGENAPELAGLIVVAPDLLAALKGALPFLPIGFAATGRGGGADKRNAALASVRAAIEAALSKAEG